MMLPVGDNGVRRRLLLAGAISAGILAALAWKAGLRLDRIAGQIRGMDLWIFGGTLIGSALWHVLLGADKWWRILRSQGSDVGYWEVFRVRLGSDPIRFVAPLKAGEIVNAVYFADRERMSFSRAAGSIVFDKALNFFGTLFWLYVGAAALARLPTAGYLVLHTCMGAGVLVLIGVRTARRICIGLAAMLHAKLGRFAEGVLSAFEEFSPAEKFGFVVYGIAFQLRPLAVCWLMMAALHPEQLPPVDELLAFGSVVVLMSNIPSLGGIGPREAAVMAMFAQYADPATLLTIGLLMSFTVQVFPAILGIPLMFPLLRELASKVEKWKSSATHERSSACERVASA